MIKVLIALLITSGCASTGIWKSASGLSTEVAKTNYGSITIEPEGLNPNWFTVKVIVENTSAATVDFDVLNIKLKNANGEIIDQLSQEEIDGKLGYATGLAGAVGGGSIYANAAVGSNLRSETYGRMIKSGKIPAKSKKVGVIYFDGKKGKGNITVLILAPTTSSDTELKFVVK